MTDSDHAASSDPDFVPGTVHLVDLEGIVAAHHASGAKRDIVLIPAPSPDPDDPLNWSPRRKNLFMFCQFVYIMSVGIASAAINSVLVPISSATSLSVNTLVEGTGYLFLMLGWGCLFFQPLAQQFGKRPIYLLSNLATMGIMIWAPHATTNGTWIANKVLQGFFGSPIESLCEVSVSDVYFTHERGRYVGYYALLLCTSNFFAPVMAGFINDGQNWQWVLYWCAIFNGAGFVINFFLMEETKFYRKPMLSAEPVADSDEDAKTGVPATPIPTRPAELHQDIEKTASNSKVDESQLADSAIQGFPKTYQKKSFLSKLHVLRKEDLAKKVKLKGLYLRPLIFFSFPVIVFCGAMYGSIVCYFNILNATSSVILSAAPYNFSPSQVGLAYISSIIGAIIGALSSGTLGDKFVLWMAKRNKGIMEPEHRLWLYCGLLVVTPGGLLLWGVGAAHHVHWFGLVFAMGLLGATIAVGCQLPVSYCIDSYKDLSGDAVVTVILIRNTMSFAVSYGITPWTVNMGYQNAFVVVAFVCMAQIAMFLIFVKWGKDLRRASVPRYLKYVEQIREDGTGH